MNQDVIERQEEVKSERIAPFDGCLGIWAFVSE